MVPYKIEFDALQWESPAEGVRYKLVRRGSIQLRLVEFTPALSHPEWCTLGHTGYLLEGEMEVRFGEETIRYSAGDGILIPSGDAHKHIPRPISEKVRFISVEEV